MTDNEIIKALECHTGKISHRCMECPYTNYGCYCLDNLHPDTLDLINRQRAEIERLTHNLEAMAQTMPNCAKAERAEAVKEFAERLKAQCRQARFSVMVTQDLTGMKKVLDNIPVVDESDIDNLVKEMVGGTE